MEGVTGVQKYLEAVGASSRELSEAHFSQETDQSPPISYDRSENVSATEKVVPTYYRNCVGILTFILDLIVALVKKCLFSKNNVDDLPQGAYDFSTKKVTFQEAHDRKLKKSEKGFEFTELVKKVKECMREVQSGFSDKEAKTIALKVANTWARLRDTIEIDHLSTEFVSFSGFGAVSGLTECEKQGYLMPPLTIERNDEVRSKKLFTSELVVSLPVSVSGLDERVVLYKGIGVGALSPTSRELSQKASSSEGVSLKFVNNAKEQETIIERTINQNDPSLNKGIGRALELVEEELFPLDGQIILYAKNTSDKKKKIVLLAKDLLSARLLDLTEAEIKTKKTKITTQVEAIVGAIQKSLGSSPYTVSYDCARGHADKKWQAKIIFTPKVVEISNG